MWRSFVDVVLIDFEERLTGERMQFHQFCAASCFPIARFTGSTEPAVAIHAKTNANVQVVLNGIIRVATLNGAQAQTCTIVKSTVHSRNIEQLAKSTDEKNPLVLSSDFSQKYLALEITSTPTPMDITTSIAKTK